MPQSITKAQCVGRQVRAALAEYGVHQADVAKALGMTGNAVSRRIVGKISFRADELIALAEFLGVDAGRFLQPIPAPRAPDQPAQAATASARGAA